MSCCKLPGCPNKVVARGMCDNHYRRWKRNGDPTVHYNKPWGSARTVRADGYIYITKNGKQVMEHRWLIEQKIGRPLTECEVVHHRDRDRQNNRLDNLVLTSRSEHSSYHASEMHLNRKHKRED